MSLFDYRQLIQKKESLEKIKFWIHRNEAKLNFLEREQHTILIYALRYYRYDVVEYLVREYDNLDLYVEDKDGDSALDILRKLVSPEEKQLLKEKDLEKVNKIEKLLVEKKFLDACS